MEEQKNIPSTDEMLKFTQEQIKVRKVQLELQELNTAITKLKCEEIEAFARMAQYNKPNEKTESKESSNMRNHTISQADLDNNPELVAEGVKVNDVIQIPA